MRGPQQRLPSPARPRPSRRATQAGSRLARPARSVGPSGRSGTYARGRCPDPRAEPCGRAARPSFCARLPEHSERFCLSESDRWVCISDTACIPPGDPRGRPFGFGPGCPFGRAHSSCRGDSDGSTPGHRLAGRPRSTPCGRLASRSVAEAAHKGHLRILTSRWRQTALAPSIGAAWERRSCGMSWCASRQTRGLARIVKQRAPSRDIARRRLTAEDESGPGPPIRLVSRARPRSSAG